VNDHENPWVKERENPQRKAKRKLLAHSTPADTMETSSVDRNC
jgi:hypothetical protein